MTNSTETPLPTREELFSMLNGGMVTVEFTKKSGEHRVMACTLHQDFLPKIKDYNGEDKTVTLEQPRSPDYIIVYEPLENNTGQFRNIRISAMTTYPVMA